MKLFRCSALVSIAAGLLAAATLSAQGQTPAAPAAPAAAPAQKLAAPVRGVAEIGHLPPKTVVQGNVVVTTFEIKNLSPGSIAGLQITEFWYDKANNPVQGTGDRQRLKTPLQPGAVATITLRSPKVPNMFRNIYQFSHANGDIKARVLKTLK